MNNKEALQEFQKMIEKEPSISAFCSSEQKWIADRRRDWECDRIQVGVIGVTSCGKSTLVNAILGQEILSSAVAPSSGQLVRCSYGKNPEVLVCFQDGREERLTGGTFTQEKLQQFSDERYNPGNRKGVLSIELSTPAFDLGRDVLLVDSPGLDAYGLEAHEKLTLESLVPTIDACIYVTTTKQNTDRKTKTVLDSVAKYNCPIIIVQNMLDSVRASPSGDKTREQVAADHKRRVRQIVDSTAISDKDSVKIIQMSAKFASQWRCQSATKRTKAMEARYQESNYGGFSSSVRKLLERQRPRIERQRLESIRREIEKLCVTLEGNCRMLEGDRRALERKLNSLAQRGKQAFPLGAFRKNFKAEIADLKTRKTQVFSHYSTQSRALVKAVEADVSPEKLERLVKETNDVVAALGKELTGLVSDCTAAIMGAASEINIPSRDLLRSASIPAQRNISMEKKYVTKTILVKRTDGPFGGEVARFFGNLFNNNWGYHEEEIHVREVDVEETKKKIRERLTDANNIYERTVRDWFSNSLDPAVGKILADIDEQETAHEAVCRVAEASYQAACRNQREAALQAEALRMLLSSLRGLVERIGKEMPTLREKADYAQNAGLFQGTRKKIEVSTYPKTLLELSRQALRMQHRSFFRKFIENVGCMKHEPVIIGWDASSMEKFLWQSGIAGARCLSPDSQVKLPAGSAPRCVFILVNTTQFGEALKRIRGLLLNKTLTKSDYVVWVVQDFQELLNGGQAVEGLREMRTLADETEIPCRSIIFIRHENPLYGWAFLELQMDPGLAKNPHFLIRDIQEKYFDYKEESLEQTISGILKNVHVSGK